MPDKRLPETPEYDDRLEEIEAGIAALVRQESREPGKLTDTDTLSARLKNFHPEEVMQVNLEEMIRKAPYRDIQKIIISTGVVYLYSEVFIAKNYAAILGRAAANDPAATIAETVREESKIYPRPTNIDLFKEQVFDISPDELDAFISKSLKHEDFNDIKVLRASTGALYLYSNKYLSADYAMSLVEWREVGEENNP